MGRWRSSAAVAAVLALAVLGPAGTAAGSETSSTLLTSLSPNGVLLATDTAHSHLLVVGPSSANGSVTLLQTRSYTGTLVTSISLPSGAQHEAFGEGSVAVSFAAPTPTQVAVYDSSTLAQKAVVDVGFTPSSLAVAGGQVWMVNGSDNSLHSMTVASPHTLTAYPGVLTGSSTLLGARSSPATIYVRDGTTLKALDVTGSPTLSGSLAPSLFSGLAVAADGSAVAVAESTDGAALLDPTTLAVTQSLSAPAEADAIALSPDGARVVVSDHVGASNDQSALYWVENPSGSVLYTDTFSDPTAALNMYASPIEFWSDTGFSVLGDAHVGVDVHPTLFRFTVPAGQTYFTSLQVPTPGGGGLGSTPSFNGHLYASPQAGVTGATVHVLVTPPGGIQSEVATPTVAGDGSFSFTSSALNHTGSWAFEFQFQASGGYAAQQVTDHITISGAADTLSLATPTAVLYGNRLTLTATLNPFTPGAVITITKTVNGVTSTIFLGPVGSSGQVTLTPKPGLSTTYQASFAGDGTYNPAASSAKKVAVLPIITGSFVGGYATSGKYRLFHYSSTCARTGNAGCPHISGAMHPAQPRRFMYLTLEQKVSGGWAIVDQFRERMGASSKALFPLHYASSAVIGHSYRIVLQHLSSATLGAVNWGFWYFRVTH